MNLRPSTNKSNQVRELSVHGRGWSQVLNNISVYILNTNFPQY